MSQRPPTPYNLDVQHHCAGCSVRADGSFCQLSDAAVATLDRSKFTSVYPKGALLFVEGELPRGVFILCIGRVKLTTSSSEGKQLIVSIAGPGEILGASATVLGLPYEVSAETLEPVQVNFLRADDFLRLIEAHADAAMQLARALSTKYRVAQREIRSLGLAQTASEKLARLLLDWCAQGETTARGVRLNVLLTHEEIAQMIGTTRETVTRLLSDFKRKKLLEIKGSIFLVVEPARLEALVTT